jgi:RNA polymerase sigma factor (TIGR02999 family)
MSEVTRILETLARGDATAAEHLLPLVYEELRRLAVQQLAKEPSGQTLQPTALVHEAYLRLVDAEKAPSWNGRGHFFAAAALAMRRILVENARRKRSLKRGGDRGRTEYDERSLPAAEPCEDLLALDAALTELAAKDRQAAELVQLRYFGGLTLPEAAAILAVSPRTAGRLWAFARAWLRRAIEG